MQATGQSPPMFRPPSRSSRDRELNRAPSARLVQPSSNRLLQDCLHKSVRSLPMGPQPHSCSGHHMSLSSLQHTCLLQMSHSEHLPHHYHPHNPHPVRPSSGHHTCPSSRSSSYEKSCVLSKSACSSKGASPMASPHLSACPSPCPSVVTPGPPPCSPDQPCSPALSHKVIIADGNRLSADCRSQQRGEGMCRKRLTIFFSNH